MWRMKQSKLKHIYFVYFLYMQFPHYPHIMCGKCAQCRKKQPFVHQPNFFEIGLVTVATVRYGIFTNPIIKYIFFFSSPAL